MRRVAYVMTAVACIGGGCRATAARSHETCVKEAIFAIQRATEKASDATGYAEALAALQSIRTETDSLNRLRDELSAFESPSRWERSRMRKHRSLWASTNEKWSVAKAEMRERSDDGRFPPDLRQNIDDAATAFEEARNRINAVIDPFWN